MPVACLSCCVNERHQPMLAFRGTTHSHQSMAHSLCRALLHSQDQGGRQPQPQSQPQPPPQEGWQGPTTTKHSSHSQAKLTHAIKACTDWQQLQGVVHNASAFNQLHVTALATRLAALVPSHPHRHSSTNGSSTEQGGEREEGNSSSQPPLDDKLQALVLHVLGLVHANVDAFDARGIANTVWALARVSRALRVLCGQQTEAGEDVTSPQAVASEQRGGGAREESASVPPSSGSEGVSELHSHAASLVTALLQRAGSSQWGMGFSPQVCVCVCVYVCVC